MPDPGRVRRGQTSADGGLTLSRRSAQADLGLFER